MGRENHHIQTILVVEDDPSVIRLVRKALLADGFGVEVASTGSEAISFISKNPGVVALLDYQLPDMTAEPVIEAFSQPDRKVPFVVMTGHGNENLAVKMMKQGAYDYVVKERGFHKRLVPMLRSLLQLLYAEEELGQATDALRSIERSLHNVLENNADGILVLDDNGIVQYVNPAAEFIFARKKKEFLGEAFGVVASTDAAEIEIMHPDGQVVIAEMRAVECEWHGRPASVISVRDITQRKQTERQLQKAHKETEQLLASITSALIGVDHKGQITHWNPAAERTFGVRSTKMLGQSIVNCSDIQPSLAALESVAKLGDQQNPERLDAVPYTRLDGSNGFLRITMHPVEDDSDVDSSYLLLAEDITNQKALEGQLRQAQKLESIGQLAAGVAHEINTPVQYVGDNTRFLSEAFDDLAALAKKYRATIRSQATRLDPAAVQELEQEASLLDLDYLLEESPIAIKQTLQGIDRIAEIVKAMKAFSHPGNEEKKPCDINTALQSTITVARNEWKYVADLKTELDPILPPVPCLRGEINQVFLNMIVNASHAISAAHNGETDQKGLITIKTRQAGKDVVIEIADNGTGIPESAQPKIFDPFFTTKEVGKGTGQGLAISHNVVVEKHQGTISFETQPGKGTTFFIRLPASQV